MVFQPEDSINRLPLLFTGRGGYFHLSLSRAYLDIIMSR